MRVSLGVALQIILAVANISTAFAGDLIVEGVLESRTPNGPPLRVNSSELVTNLNADRIDGYEISDFASAGTGPEIHWKNLVGMPGNKIDQDCAVNTGCFAGDDPGVPV